MKNKKIITYALVSVLGLSALTGVASARGFGGGFGLGASNLSADEIASRQQTMFQNEANLLGIEVSKIIEGWSQGKTLQQIAKDNGITQDQLAAKLKAKHDVQLKTQLQTLVSKGIITQAQADQRLSIMQNKANTKSIAGGRGGKMGGKGLNF